MSSPLNLSYKTHSRVVVAASPEVDEDYVQRFDELLSEDANYSPRRKLDFDAPAAHDELVNNNGSDDNETAIVEPLKADETKVYSGMNNQASVDGTTDSEIKRTLLNPLPANAKAMYRASFFQKLINRFWHRNKTKPQTQRKWSFNAVSIHERIFWESYVELDRQEHGHYGQSTLQGLYYLLKAHIERLALTSNYDEWSKEAKEFWLFYFNRTKYIGLGLFSFNLISMTSIFAYLFYCSITNTAQYNKYSNELRLSFVLYMMGWYSLNLLCLGCYLVFTYHDKFQSWLTKSSFVVEECNSNLLNYNGFFLIWIIVGRTILAARYLFFFHFLITSYVWSVDSRASKNEICPTLYMLPEGMHNFLYLALIILFDIYQITVISFFPCPWPWIFRLCFIECLSTIWRMKSCFHLIGDFPNHDAILICICFIFVRFYIVSVCFSILAFEQKMRSAFANIQRQHIAAEDKIKMINLLCRDIKLPAQQVMQTLISIDSLISNAHNHSKGLKLSPNSDTKCKNIHNRDSIPLSLSGYIDQAKQCSSTLNILIDGLLLLNKVEEGRFTMHFQDSLNIVQLTRETLDLISESVSANQIPKSTWYKMCRVNADAIPPSYSVKSESQSFKLMLYYSFLALLSMACDDNLDENFDKLFESYLTRCNLECSESEIIQWFTVRTELAHDKKVPWLLRKGQRERTFIMVRISLDVVIPFNLGKHNNGIRKRFAANRGGMLESSCLICHKAATAIGGNWNISMRDQQLRSSQSVSRNGLVTLMMPCHAKDCILDRMINVTSGNGSLNNDAKGSSLRGSLPSDKVPMSTGETAEIIVPELSSRERRAVRLWITTKSFVFLKDASFESIIMDILFRLKIKANNLAEISMLRTLTTAEMKIYEVAFVHSIESCLEVRKKQFAGRLILFCERVAYLDEEEKCMCDYVVPLPASDLDLTNLMQYLYGTSQQKNDSLFVDKLRHIATKQELSLLTLAVRMIHTMTKLHQDTKLYPKQLFKLWEVTKRHSKSAIEKYCKVIISFLFIDPIVPERRESFTKWRFLSPSGRIIHHTLYLEIADFSWLAIVFYQLMENITSLRNCVYFAIIVALFYSRRFIHGGILRHTRIGYRTWWNCSNFIVLSGYIAVVFEFVRVRGVLHGGKFSIHPIVKETQHDQTTLFKFATSDHGHLSGIQSILSIILFPAQIRYFVEIFPWPFGHICTLIACLKCCLIVELYFRNYFYATHINLMIAGLCFCAVASLFFHNSVVALSEDSFTSLYDLLLSKDFFDRIFLVGNTTMSLPLQRLQLMQTEVLEMIVEKALQEKLLLVATLHQHVTILKVNLILLKELRHHLNVMSQGETQYFHQQPRSVLISRMKAKLVKVIVESICSQFVQSITDTGTLIRSGHRISLGIGGDINIKFTLKVDPALTLVKVDEDLFGSMLSFLLRQVIQKIEKYVSFLKAHVCGLDRIREGGATRFLDHEVLIWIRPVRNVAFVTMGHSDFAGSWIGSKTFGSQGKSGAAAALGSPPKFTDVRTMLVTLFDTCKPIYHTVGDNHQLSDSQESTTGYPLCDRIMKFFDSNVRYEVGNLSSSISKHYHGYQQVGVPYMLCPDSHRLQQFVEMSNLVGDKMHHVVEKKAFYSRYCNQYDNGLLNILDGSVSYPVVGDYGRRNENQNNAGRKKVEILRSPLEKRSKSRKTVDSPSVPHRLGENRKSEASRRKFVGRALLLSYDHSFATEQGYEPSSRSSIISHFRTLSWKCQSYMVKYLHDVICNHHIHKIDCLLVDANIKLLVSPSPLIHQYSNHMSLDSSGWPIAKGKDIIHLLRHVGFTGLIVLLENRSAFQSSPLAEHYSTNSFNPTIHAVKEDISVQYPITLDDVKYITLTTEKHILSNL